MRKILQYTLTLTLLLTLLFLSGGTAAAQSDMIKRVEAAFRVGSSQALAQAFDREVEITLPGEEATSYSRAQAEFVMKNFFGHNAPVGFRHSHQGASEKGQRYAIGTYDSENGSYTVLVRLRGDAVHAINFIKD